MAIASVASVLAELPVGGGLFTQPTPPTTDTGRWIATDRPPFFTQPWPILAELPLGWHNVSPAEAAELQKLTRRVTFLLTPSGDAATDLAALSTGELATAGSAARRPGRTPRPPRVPRVPRPSRPPRTPRAARSPRAPRAPRRSRPPRLARFPRPPRPARRPYAKTKLTVGQCKRPTCHCWTPAGCIGPDLYALEKLSPDWPGLQECFPGPCYDYAACVTQKCFAEVACEIQSIFQFWARQYQAAVTYVVPPVVAAAQRAQRAGLAALGRAAELGATLVAVPIPPGGFTQGCPPGTRWVIGLTGCSCQPIDAPYPLATAAQIKAACGVDVTY
jgi:hypothetical protein